MILQGVIKPQEGISNDTLTGTHKSSNTTSRRRDCYGAKKPNNLVVISKSYIEKTKAVILNNKAMKAEKKSTKARQSRKFIRDGTF